MTKSPKPRIAVAMSGGVDSSVAAAMLRDKGWDVIGLTAHMWQEGSRCCSQEDIAAAQAVARRLDIRHYVINATELFQEVVVDPFLEEYARGRTPSPCILCNRRIKFGLLLQRARELDCTHIATGHYARIETTNALMRLFRGRDATKDQSYYLHRLGQDELRHIIFPLGELVKTGVTAYAREHDLPRTSRGESQDLCFIEPGHLGNFVRKHRPAAAQTGPVETSAGVQIGTHEGLFNFTVGQRKGLKVAVGQPLYVLRLDRARNAVIVGTADEAARQDCIATGMHWIAGHAPSLARGYTVRLRYRQQALPATLIETGRNRVAIHLDRPQPGIAPGQAAVIYDGDEVLGGGWIE